MVKIKTIDELRNLSLEQIKFEYAKLTKLYAQRMWHREKEDAASFKAMYGERLTAKQLYNKYLAEQERSKYILAYDALVRAMGGEMGATKKAIQQEANRARDFLQSQGIDIAGMNNAEAIKAFNARKKFLDTHAEFYDWYEELVEDFEDVDDKSTVGTLVHAEGFDAVRNKYAGKSKEEYTPEEIEMMKKMGYKF